MIHSMYVFLAQLLLVGTPITYMMLDPAKFQGPGVMYVCLLPSEREVDSLLPCWRAGQPHQHVFIGLAQHLFQTLSRADLCLLMR
ncbi:hypothetical protein F4810DRAFT_670643 [Camillea tinctor]|nr:hypothetical protein F4810DRAFT_670643 [Camillea tinctor]